MTPLVIKQGSTTCDNFDGPDVTYFEFMHGFFKSVMYSFISLTLTNVQIRFNFETNNEMQCKSRELSRAACKYFRGQD